MEKGDKIVDKETLRSLIQPIIRNEVQDYFEKEIRQHISNNIVEGGLISFRDWQYIDEG